MKRLFTFLAVILAISSTAMRAQVSLDSRFDYSHDFAESAGRFGGKGLILDVNGEIGSNFSYSLNHCIAKFEGGEEIGFGNTNWLTLTYENDYFYITAGKEDIKIGNFEYNEYDLDSYSEMNSLFWNYISPWQWGVSAGWYPAEGHTLLLQCVNSPFSDINTFNLFAYALAWKSEWNFYEPYWSVNMWQYDKGRYIKALNLGNRFYAGHFRFDLDYSTRTATLENAFTSDFTLTFAPSYEWEWGRAFAKVGWDRVTEDHFGYGFIGSNIFYGAGVEVFPLKGYKDLRIHTIWASNTKLSADHFINVGLTWKMNLTDAVEKLINKLKKD